jgi:hypothetical protein
MLECKAEYSSLAGNIGHMEYAWGFGESEGRGRMAFWLCPRPDAVNSRRASASLGTVTRPNYAKFWPACQACLLLVLTHQWVLAGQQEGSLLNESKGAGAKGAGGQCVCVCVCVRERERDRKGHTHTHTHTHRERERERENTPPLL